MNVATDSSSLHTAVKPMAVCAVLSVKPTRALVDEKWQIVANNLKPNQEVTLYSIHQTEDKDCWEAYGHYISDEHGTVSVSKDASSGGTYTGVEPMGLLWSMHPVPGSRHGLRMRKKDVTSPMLVSVSVFSGHLAQGFSEKDALATVVTERWYLAPGVQRVDISERGVKGTFFIPPGPGPFPAVLDMWGGGGGLVEYRAALFASHGFLTMALEYLSADEQRSYDVGTEYFEKSYDLLQSHPRASPGRVAVLGLSFGAAVTFTLAAYSKTVKPQCCICISGTHVFPLNESPGEVEKRMKRNTSKAYYDENHHVVSKHTILPIPATLEDKVDVGQIKCPLLIVAGQDDQNWAAVESAEDIQQMMDLAGNGHLLTVLSYPDAGHLIEPPYTPHVRFSNFINRSNGQKVLMLWGGHPEAHAVAQEDSWTKILHFLHTHLYKDTIPAARL
ncbi:peroxisomal succinyl-coenzyme A thioesterase-like [Engraulis encrasicolus]|uniref:peroxisomal succinyl-coenzyme A thioesterase-like n=1 Tax=Engraulis encrasicolus TaxID=184585 RepID=UPI002FD49405